MKRTMIQGPGFCAVTEDGILVEYLEPDPENQSGDIVLGTVGRMMSGPECAFVNIGRRQAAFLPLRENSLSFDGIPLRSGMKVAVQVRKEETGRKGAYLTRDLTLAGQYLLLMPCNRYIGVSSRVKEEESRAALRNLGEETAAGRSGIVMRESSLHAAEEDIRTEYESLLEIWKSVAERIRTETGDGTVVYRADPVKQMADDYRGKGSLDFLQAEEAGADLRRQLRLSRERKLPTANGGNIVIDRCEAMTVIDVNSGSAAARSGNIFLETNLAACDTIAAQIRLRDIAGIILIDFIDMNSDTDRAAVEERLRTLLERDRRKTVLHGWTKLGLMEMTRKRTGH
jgi:ribonuclease G